MIYKIKKQTKNQRAVHPPSIVKASPLISEAYSEHKKRAAYPISSVLTNFKEGYFSYKRSLHPSSNEVLFFSLWVSIYFLIKSVKTNPGQIQFAVMPLWTFSSATTFVIPRIPCLEATYGDLFTEAIFPWTEAMFMIRPQFFFYMWGIMYFIV